ncbi:hypothetical protein [Mariniflexile sp. HMF6888]|uniref:hypothetical protein n=1 Tax=Mariniflexile sp. HMF6888 TaxID=3373086 RepID=UPI00378BAECB
MNKILLLLSIPFLAQAQVQTGQSIDGESQWSFNGQAIAISANGSIMATGANGHNSDVGQVRVFENIAGTWTQIGNDILGYNSNDNLGWAIDISADGSVVVAGAPYNSDTALYAGQVRVFENIAGTWTQIGQNLLGDAASDLFGISVAISPDGSTIAVGAPSNDTANNNAGQVKIFKNISGTWTQVGSTLLGVTNNDNFGKSLALSNDGSIVAIGADQLGMITNGYVKVYENIAGTWTQIGTDIIGEASQDRSGISVDITPDGSTVAIGAINNDGINNNAGHVRVYENIAGTWTQKGGDIDGEADLDASGQNLALSSNGEVVSIGALYNGGNGNNAGHVRLFTYSANTWTQVGNDIDGENAGDRSGYTAISADGRTVVVGSSYYSSASFDQAGRVRVFDFTSAFNTLSIEDFDSETSVFIRYNSNNEIQFKTNKSLFQNIKIYDITGKLLLSKENINRPEFIIKSDFSNQLIIVKSSLNNNEVFTTKLIR